nr:zinc knuckle CX2CX4HX4C [Tanacetum cinerariifolium]
NDWEVMKCGWDAQVLALLYEWESLTMEDILTTLILRELGKRIGGTKEETHDGLYIMGMPHHSDGHIKRDCPINKSSGSIRKGKHDHDSFDDEPIMLDSYTSSMCIESWGISSLTRCLIEINAADVLKESLTMGVPLIKVSRFTIETITIEYEWKPPCCDQCKIFGHVHDYCPKIVSVPPTFVTHNVVTPTVEKTNDGF